LENWSPFDYCSLSPASLFPPRFGEGRIISLGFPLIPDFYGAAFLRRRRPNSFSCQEILPCSEEEEAGAISFPPAEREEAILILFF